MSTFNNRHMISNEGKQRTCYIASSSHINLKTLKELLVEREVRPIIFSEQLLKATAIIDEVMKRISEADLFIAVLDSTRESANTYFELGIAVANKIPAFILASSKMNLPLDVKEIPSIRADPTNRDAINFALNQILATPISTKYEPRLPLLSSQLSQPIGDFASELLRTLDSSNDITEAEVVRLFAEALRKSGLSIMTEHPIPEASPRHLRQVDLAVWSDEFDIWFGNPLLIEVKRLLRSREDCLDAVRRVTEYLQMSNSQFALILYVKKSQSISDLLSISPPNIYFIDIHELLTEMRTKSFAEIIRNLRNQRAHGVDR